MRRLPVTLEPDPAGAGRGAAAGIGFGHLGRLALREPADHTVLTATLFGISLPEFFVGAADAGPGRRNGACCPPPDSNPLPGRAIAPPT